MLKVLIYNIHGARGGDRITDYRRIGNFFKNQNLDIVLLQEVDTRHEDRDTDQDIADLKTDHFPYFSAAPTLVTKFGWYGNGVLSRYPILRETILDISAKGREPRNIQEVFVKTPEGELHVINTHKGLRRGERGGQLRRLSELLSNKSEVPLIVGGDINEWQSYAVAIRRLNRLLHAVPTGRTFPTFCPLFHLDRLWCRPLGLVKSCSTLRTPETRYYSDHFPLLAEVDVQNS